MGNAANINLTRRAILNFTALKGDTFLSTPIEFNINDEPEDFDGSTLLMQVKKNGRLIIELDEAAGIQRTDNVIVLSISADDMEDLFIADRYQYDLQKTVGNVVTTILAGTITVLNEVTQ